MFDVLDVDLGLRFRVYTSVYVISGATHITKARVYLVRRRRRHPKFKSAWHFSTTITRKQSTMDMTTNGAGAPQYCFPILKSQEILSCIDEMGVEVSQQELADPIRHKEKLRQVWLALVRGVDATALRVFVSHSA